MSAVDQLARMSGACNGAIARADRPDDLPLSFAQQRLWFLDRLAPGNPFYVETSAFRLHGAIHARALEMSLGAMADRHEVLRTSFANVDGRPLQRIAPSIRVPLELVDLAVVAPARRNDELDRIVLERATTPFDLTGCPLLRATLVRLAHHDHVLVLAMHHIITDGWSMQVFGRELSVLYRCLVTGERVELPELPIQYADYAIWQRSDERSAAVERQLGYWQERLAGLSIVELPTDHPRPATFSYRGGDERFVIPSGVCARLTEFARGERVTTFMVGFAVWASLLARYADQTDIVVGVPIAGRDRPEVEHLVGCFLNNLVVRVDLADDPTFRELVGRTRDVVVGAFAHQDVPFERLVEELQPVRDLARHPLFQVMFQYFDTDGATGAPHDHVAVRRTTAILDLFLHLWDDGPAIRGKIEYCSDLFDPATVRAMAHQYVVLTRAAIDAPDTPVSRLPIVSSADRAELAELALGPDLVVDGPPTLVELWDGQVAAPRGSVALVEGDRRWTYGELDARAREIGDRLLAGGLSPGSVAGVCLERSVDAIASQLAIVALGGAWVALDPSSPQRVLDHILGDSGASMVVTASRHADLIAGTTTVVHVDAPGRVEPRPWDRAMRPRAHDIACLIYTSGSTGHPKGVMVEHRGIHNRLAWMWQAFPFEADEVLALKTAPSFVDSIWETFGPLLAGVPAVVLTDDTVRDPRMLVDALAHHGVTRLLVVPSLLRALLDSGREIGLELPRLQRWFTSGEVLTPALVERFGEFLSGRELVNLYGSSEIAGDVTAGTVTPGSGWVTIGRSIANTRIHILDDRGTPVPIGVPGRIIAAGANVARGYHRRPALTAASFVPDPFSRRPGARMYDTGDRGRWRRDGTIEFLGRRDHQVKVRGVRVELGHVERALLDHPGVSQAAVLWTDAAVDGGHLVAFVRSDADVAELRTHARRHLAEQMVPATFVLVESLPLTPNGKVDRSALASLDAPAVSDREYVAPSTEAQRQMAEVWTELLDVERVGVEDDFFDLGGHSLLATRLVSLVRGRFGVEMPLTMVFERPELGEMAAGLEELIVTEIASMSDDEVHRELRS